MDTFDSRMDGASEKEKSDAASLEAKYECVVDRFGQGQLTHRMREYLRKYPGPDLFIRWLPDLIVARRKEK